MRNEPDHHQGRTHMAGAAAATETSRSKFWLVTLGLVVGGLLLAALGAFAGPYRTATAEPGKITVESCVTHFKKSGSGSSSTRDRVCYGTYKSADGKDTDLNATFKSSSSMFDRHTLYSKGSQADVEWIGGTNYVRSTTGTFAFGLLLAFLGLLPLAAGVFVAATSTAFEGGGWNFNVAKRQSGGLLRVCTWVGGIAAVGAVLSAVVWLMSPS
jgi:hypothetical protein